MKKISEKQRKAAITLLRLGSAIGTKKDMLNRSVLLLRLMTGVTHITEQEDKIIFNTAQKLNKNR